MALLQQQVMASYSWACQYARSCTSVFSSSFDREELESAGILGYVVAANRYDETKGNSFRSFCATRIRGAIMDELRRSSWESRSSRRNHRLIVRTGLDLEARLHRWPSQAELANAMGLEEADLAEMQRFSQPASYVSLDDEVVVGNDDETFSLKEILPDQSAAIPSAAYDLAEMRSTLCASIVKLPPVEASVIVLHYLRNIPFHEIAHMMKVTPSRISQQHHRALHALKKLLRDDDENLHVSFS